MKKLKGIFRILLLAIMICILFGCVKKEEPKKQYTIEFLPFSTKGGYIEGQTVQTIEEGKNSEKVIAIAYEGYYFEGWVDLGAFNEDETITQGERIIENVDQDRTYYASFKITKRDTYQYNYLYATSNCDETQIELIKSQLSDTKLIVPQRDGCTFGGWFADEAFTTQIADETGKIVISSEELYNLETTQFYAKWISPNEYIYKILLIYVTEVHAELTKRDKSGTIQVDYVMTETERKICHIATEKVSTHLNSLSIAKFQVDEYFTTVPITKEEISEGSHGSEVSNWIDAYKVSEVCEMADNYQSVLISYSFNDREMELRNSNGGAEAKYGNIYLDATFRTAILNRIPIEMMLDPQYYPDNKSNAYWYETMWCGLTDTYIHELAHTIEQKINAFEYHKILSAYQYEYDPSRPYRSTDLYFLNQAVVDGEVVGIPYEYWEGKVARIYYETGPTVDGRAEGYVWGAYPYIPRETKRYGESWDGDLVQYVIYGYNAVEVTAFPLEGYEFVCWSDGVTTATRQDINVRGDLYVKAIFRKIE